LPGGIEVFHRWRRAIPEVDAICLHFASAAMIGPDLVKLTPPMCDERRHGSKAICRLASNQRCI
jgi:hypothetical protein